MSRLPNLDDLSFDAVIPSVLLLNDNIEPNAIKLYAFVRGLTKAHGYCYASNEYLSFCMKCDESTVRRLLKSLEDEGFIVKKWQESDGKRHIYLGGGLKKPLEGGVLKFEQGGAQNQAGGCSKSSTRYKDNVSDVNISDDKEAPAVPMYVSNYKAVKLTLDEFNKLVEKHGEALILQKIKDLDEYSYMKPKAFKEYGSHYHVILNWLRREEADKPKSSSSWIDVLKSKLFCRRDIYISDESIVFSGGVSQIEIRFTDHGYKEQILSRLRKMNIPVEGL